MNRREALAALVAMPEIARITSSPVQPNDVIVVESTMALSSEAAARITSSLERIWPGRRIVVLDSSLTLKIVQGSQV